MNPTYEPSDLESRWYDVWEQAGVFRPEINPDGEPFAIVIPPPNVTGVLHMGHALDMSIQDAIIRRKRMQGFQALWLPGSDHAGIATQNVVERELANEGLTRHDLGRERFVDQVWAWKAASGNRITEQMRTLGFSTDWTRWTGKLSTRRRSPPAPLSTGSVTRRFWASTISKRVASIRAGAPIRATRAAASN